MAEETQYKANTGLANITIGTSSMTGSGSTLLLTAGAAAAGFCGTRVKDVIIKGKTSTTEDCIIRIFVKDKSTNYLLLAEQYVPRITQASINKTFEISLNLDFALQPDYSLYVSTSVDGNFNIIAEGLNWNYYATSVRPDTTQYTANNTVVSDATANSNLDGTGTLVTAYTAGSSATYKGSSIETITVKATVNNTPGMCRLYIYNGTTSFLFKEVVVPSITKTATDKAFEHTIVFEDNFDLQAGYLIKASVQNAENVNFMIEGKDWNYPA